MVYVEQGGRLGKTYFVAPFEVGVFHEGPVPNLALKQVMNVLINNGFNNDVKFGKIICRQIVILRQTFRLLTERASGFTNVPVFDGDRKVFPGTILAA